MRAESYGSLLTPRAGSAESLAPLASGSFGLCSLLDSILVNSAGFARRRGMLAALLPPEAAGNCEGIDIALLPPIPLLTGGVDVVMVDGAERHGELVAHLEA